MDDSGEDRDLLDPTVIKAPGRGERKKWPVAAVFVCTTVVVTVLLLGAGELTEKPHIAGNVSDMEVAMLIYNRWKGYKTFDRVELANYTVLLQYPGNSSSPNRLELRESGGKVVYTAATRQEKPLLPQERDPSVAPPFNAYSGTGNVSGPLVYVNYGRLEDFYYLNTTLNISLDGYVCIIRYGKIYRGDKVTLNTERVQILPSKLSCLPGRAKWGIGVIIYSDPADYAPRGGPLVFPNGTSLPPSGVQRGSLFQRNGDPLTPGVPAIPGIFRRDYEEDVVKKGYAPSIPVQPISYGDAIHFMNQLTEYRAPVNLNWTGQLNLSCYYILQSPNNTNETYLEVNNYLVHRNITNVIATVYGSVEPDRYVLLGNHHDAWTFGAVDPNSGTAVLMELARALSDLRSKDWRPGRTILLCSWDAEEYGLIGSYEWTEEHAKILGANAVAYLNVDVAIDGIYSFNAAATPLLIQPIYTATKTTKCPNKGFATVYDEWLHYQPNPTNSAPQVPGLGSGSDYTSFLQGFGITCSDMNYRYFDPIGYPVYHSVHDNFFYEANLTDPSFSHHTAVGLVWGKVALSLATSPVLPYDPRDYSTALTNIMAGLVEEYGEVLSSQNISLDYLNSSIREFTMSAECLWEELQKVSGDPSDLSRVRRLNDQLMQLERAFIVPEGLPGRPYYKHVVYAPSSVNQYGSSLFPGVSDAIFAAMEWGGSWDLVREQLDLVRVHILYASQIMTQSLDNTIAFTTVGKDTEDLEQWTSCSGQHFEPRSLYSRLQSKVALLHSTNGDYRPLRPKYGTYEYLPPQRWLSALQYGAVVFLYHPCTPPDQVSQLKQLARSCLWRHFVSPYPLLDSEWPMAVVSWGCVLRVKWVESEAIKKWVESHALRTPQTAEFANDGTYDEGLIQPADKVELLNGDEAVCPSPPPPTTILPSSTNTTNSSKPTCPNTATSTNSSHNKTDSDCSLPPTPTFNPAPASNLPLHHHFGYTVLMCVAGAALLLVILVSALNLCCCSATRRRRRRARYKSVSKFFPFSYGEQLDADGGSDGVSVAIPEYGLPKSGRAEREMLLNESDEDEI
ncbi:N-acetylated-alpha-linked acidic dipeptidase 2 [Geodia barretti]|uniref:glutamate carboxypeptidase II n=1 Tax=Geodia barretti TaxID=519541 RepID=A0AA35TRF2_GEOBA|nr:N-acetylated-alpha-linked acidic dipeptidase 2 [Geodia barretti]